MEEKQSEQTQKKDKEYIKSSMLALVGLILILVLSIYLSFNMYKEKDHENDKNRADFVSMMSKFQNVSRYSDSLYKVNMKFDMYRHAAESQAFRDSICRRMIHKPGDLVYRKIDSAKVLITDIVIGGGKYDYYFRYRIIDASDKESEIKPELIYNKK